MQGFFGGGGLKIHIDLHADPHRVAAGEVVPLDHVPSWKTGKNPFASLPKKTFENGPQPPPPPTMQIQQQPNQWYGGNSGTATPLTGANGIMEGGGNNGVVVYAYGDGQDVQGAVHLILPPGKSYDHLGVKVQLLGRITMKHATYESRPHYDFISLLKELQPPGTLYQTQTSIPFYFNGVDQPYETYNGRNVSVRYIIRVLVERKFFPAMKHDQDIIIQKLGVEPRLNEMIKMEVGIEDCLHIEFQYKKRCFHLTDCIVGTVHFMLVMIKIKYMELAVIRRESCGDGLASNVASTGIPSAHIGGNPNTNNGHSVLTETQTLTRYEIMDGAPVKGESIPVRLYLAGIPADLTPTFDSANNRFSVRYFLNLVLVDEEDRRYFKQQEIFLWRKEYGN